MDISYPGDPDELPSDDGGCSRQHCHGRRSMKQPDVIEHAIATGKRLICHKPAGWGTKHPGTGRCKNHGGGTPNADVKARRDLIEQASMNLGTPIDVGPSEALLDELKQTAGTVAWLRSIIQGMDQEDLVWGVAEELVEPDIRDEEGQILVSQVSAKWRAVPNVWYALYMQERAHLVRVCKEAIIAGVSERIVNAYQSVYEQVADVYMGLLENVLMDLNLTDEQRAAVPAAVVKRLRAIQGGTEDG